MVTDEQLDELLVEFKERMHISHNEDRNLKQLLSSSIAYIRRKCGEFDLERKKETDISAKELVFERTRYAYNDALEYFEDNFLSEINSLSIEMLPEDDDDATV